MVHTQKRFHGFFLSFQKYRLAEYKTIMLCTHIVYTIIIIIVHPTTADWVFIVQRRRRASPPPAALCAFDMNIIFIFSLRFFPL